MIGELQLTLAPEGKQSKNNIKVLKNVQNQNCVNNKIKPTTDFDLRIFFIRLRLNFIFFL